ncbi:hypothetical protein L209DRAFT_276125 [Thermothelomyces heterothallicus CBS 203.75]
MPWLPRCPQLGRKQSPRSLPDCVPHPTGCGVLPATRVQAKDPNDSHNYGFYNGTGAEKRHKELVRAWVLSPCRGPLAPIIGCSHLFECQGTAATATCGFGRADSRCSGIMWVVSQRGEKEARAFCVQAKLGKARKRNLSEHKCSSRQKEPFGT